MTSDLPIVACSAELMTALHWALAGVGSTEVMLGIVGLIGFSGCGGVAG